MRQLPSILWYLELTQGSSVVSKLEFKLDWRLADIEGAGSPPIQHNTVRLYGIGGDLSSSYQIESRPLILGVFYKGARTQKDYYLARKKLLDFVRPNQYKPVKLYVTLPDRETYALKVAPSPGAPLPLARDRRHTFLEPVTLIAHDPIWVNVKDGSASIATGSATLVSAPNKATVAISSDSGSVQPFSVKVELGVSSGSGGSPTGFIVEKKEHDDPDSEYTQEDAGNAEEYTLQDLGDQVHYDIRATAYNSGGDSPISDVLEQTTPQYIPPLAAPDVTASPGPETIDLSWTAVTNATGYQVRHKLNTGALWGEWADVSGTTYQITGLSEQVSYDIEVRATFLLDDGSTSYGAVSQEMVMTQQYEAPGPPTNVRVRTQSNGNFTLSFSAPTSGGPVSYYTIRWGAHGGRNRTKNVGSPGSVGLGADDVLSASPHGFTIWAVGPGGTSSSISVSSS